MSATMVSQRALRTSTRRFATANVSIINNSLRFASPSAVALGQTRLAATSASPSGQSQVISQSQGYDILAAQRRQRPISPHLSIYKPQITWYGSITNRITGAILSGGFYIFGFGYLIAPYVGLHWESASIAAWFAGLGIATKIGIKTLLAWPFAYHSLNGIRHLVWDAGAALSNKQVIVTGWTVVALSVATGAFLTFY